MSEDQKFTKSQALQNALEITKAAAEGGIGGNAGHDQLAHILQKIYEQILNIRNDIDNTNQ